jgi:hypothetical protein
MLQVCFSSETLRHNSGQFLNDICFRGRVSAPALRVGSLRLNCATQQSLDIDCAAQHIGGIPLTRST